MFKELFVVLKAKFSDLFRGLKASCWRNARRSQADERFG
jgi:hypothetical protein